jgi:hypothetical protein
VTRYRFEEVRASLQKHWGLSLDRGGRADERYDGRWTVEYSRTGFIVGGAIPGHGHGHRRYTSLAAVVRVWELDAVIQQLRVLEGAP